MDRILNTKEIDISGVKFNKLLALGKSISSDNKSRWVFKCDCGSIVTKIKDNVTCNLTTSCGCFRKRKGRNSTHKLSKTKFYKVWAAIKRRCSNPKDISYENYGGRGITISDEWMTFENFYNDMFESYKEGLSIERMDNNKGYSKENCCWATRKEQCINRRSTHFVTIEGQTLSFSDTCRKYGIKISTAKSRLNYGWTYEQIFILKERI